MEVLVPIAIFGIGIIISTTLASIGIKRIVEGEEADKAKK